MSRAVVLKKKLIQGKKKGARILTPVTSPNLLKASVISSSVVFQDKLATKMVLLGASLGAALGAPTSDSLFGTKVVLLGVSEDVALGVPSSDTIFSTKVVLLGASAGAALGAPASDSLFGMVLLGVSEDVALRVPSSDTLFATKVVLLGASAGAALGAPTSNSSRAPCDVVNDRGTESDTFLSTAVLNATRDLMFLVAKSGTRVTVCTRSLG